MIKILIKSKKRGVAIIINESWSKLQKKHARELFDLARDREYKALIEEISALEITSSDEVWELRDKLNRKAKEMDRRYDYRYSQLIFVFAELVNTGYLSLKELAELGEEKLEEIRKLSSGVLG